MKLTRAAAASCAIAVAALTLGACGVDDKDDSSATKTSASSSESTTNEPDITRGAAPSSKPAGQPSTPSTQTLSDRLKKLFDGTASKEEKIKWLENGEQDPTLADRLVEAAKKNNITVEVVKVNDPKDGKLTADAKANIGGKETPSKVEFVAEEGEWKVAAKFTCSLVKLAGLQSAACQI